MRPRRRRPEPPIKCCYMSLGLFVRCSLLVVGCLGFHNNNKTMPGNIHLSYCGFVFPSAPVFTVIRHCFMLHNCCFCWPNWIRLATCCQLADLLGLSIMVGPLLIVGAWPDPQHSDVVLCENQQTSSCLPPNKITLQNNTH